MRIAKTVAWLVRRLPKATQDQVFRELRSRRGERGIVVGAEGAELIWAGNKIIGHEIYGADMCIKYDKISSTASTVFAPAPRDED